MKLNIKKIEKVVYSSLVIIAYLSTLLIGGDPGLSIFIMLTVLFVPFAGVACVCEEVDMKYARREKRKQEKSDINQTL